MLLSPGAPRASVQDALPALAAQLTHDLNNQLTTIMGKAELALMGQDPVRWQQALKDVYEAGVRSQRMVADMQKVLSWVGAEHGPVPLREAVLLALRLTERHVDSCAIAIQLRGDSARAVASYAGDLVVALWRLISAARAAGSGESRGWVLELADGEPDGWTIRFGTPELNWSADWQLRAAIGGFPDQLGVVVEGSAGELQLRRR